MTSSSSTHEDPSSASETDPDDETDSIDPWLSVQLLL